MIAHDEPIGYELTDPADEADHGLQPVNSTFYDCCLGIGQHAATCTRLATVPTPTGATGVGDWHATDWGGHAYRWFVSEFFPALPDRDWLGAHITGQQYVAPDGEVTNVYLIEPVTGVGGAVIPSQAMALAAAIRQASERAAVLSAENGCV